MREHRRSRGEWRCLPFAFLAGAVLGAATSLTSALGSPYGPFTATPGEGILMLEYLSAWLGSAWAWGLFAFAIGWITPSMGRGVLGAVDGLLLAVVAYYVSDMAIGVNESLSTSEIVLWSLVAIVVGPVMAALGNLAHRPPAWSVLPGLAAPALMVVDALLRPAGSDHIREWVWLGVLLGAGLLTGCLLARGAVLLLSLPGRRGSSTAVTVNDSTDVAASSP